MLRSASLTARRLRQTVGSFDNGGRVLLDLGRRADELTVKTHGLTITCPNVAGARVPLYEIFAENAYRLDWFTQGLRDGFVAVDIGGHVGCFSTALATERSDAAVNTFEASPTTFQYLQRNVQQNGLGDRVSVNHLALAPEAGTLEFADNSGGSGLNGITAPEGSPVIQVPATTIAAVFAEHGPVDLVKIDTEGAEYGIVLASDPADWSTVSRVVLEYHDVPGHSWDELVSFFGSAGLDVVRHEPVSDRLGTAWLSRGPVG